MLGNDVPDICDALMIRERMPVISRTGLTSDFVRFLKDRFSCNGNRIIPGKFRLNRNSRDCRQILNAHAVYFGLFSQVERN